ncbi:hypothetical protein chiPu_0026410, partial [Chiloscyllium punctatum]|nr:hypothetical protein [Chiloscyllium punctatum]
GLGETRGRSGDGGGTRGDSGPLGEIRNHPVRLGRNRHRTGSPGGDSGGVSVPLRGTWSD